jgi:hypothetical protein
VASRSTSSKRANPIASTFRLVLVASERFYRGALAQRSQQDGLSRIAAQINADGEGEHPYFQLQEVGGLNPSALSRAGEQLRKANGFRQ